MVSYLGRLAALAAIVAPVIFAAPTAHTPHLKIRNAFETDVVKDSYIVVYNEDIEKSAIASHRASVDSLVSKRDVGGFGATYDLGKFQGFQITADPHTIDEIAAAPEVAYVEKDTKVYASALVSQTGATWGLGRISHRNPGSTTYIYDSSAGAGTTVYIIDTGIYTAHSQFGGRASFGANFVDSSNTDGNGHGTHCAGTVGGSTYGVAKAANLVAVKVLGANGSGSNSGVISGIQWVANNRVPGKSVISMSLGGSYSAATNSAVRATIAAGVTTVVAAGNENQNAANVSPASEPLAITVGAIDSSDNRASFSNYGSVVDIFGPGVNVLSSWIGGTTATRSISGTSMATPHVAGLAAYLIALEGLSSPAAVQARIKALGTAGKVVGPGSGSPNLIAYNGNGA